MGILKTEKFWKALSDCASKCDHTYKAVKKALRKLGRSKDYDYVIDAVRKQGGFCDCEIWFNAFGPIVGRETADEWMERWRAEERKTEDKKLRKLSRKVLLSKAALALPELDEENLIEIILDAM